MEIKMKTKNRHPRADRDNVLRAVIASYQPGILRARESIRAVGATVAHPLAAPSVSGTTITVETMLQQPTRITRMIMDLTLQRFIADRVFASAGGVTGGAVIYDEATLNELYLARDVERVAPGMEFPIVTSDRQVPKIAPVEKWGGKVWISDEARDRNNSAAFANQIRQLSNTIIRRLNQRVIETLETSITASGQTVTGRNWSTYNPNGSSATAPQQGPLRDFALAAQMAEEDELGVTYTLWLLNPQEYANLIIGLGGPGNLGQFLSMMNTEIYVSNRVTAGTAYVVAGQSTGEMRIEKPLGTETWRDPQGRERTWVQASVRPVFYVTNPYAVLKFVGLAG